MSKIIPLKKEIGEKFGSLICENFRGTDQITLLIEIMKIAVKFYVNDNIMMTVFG